MKLVIKILLLSAMFQDIILSQDSADKIRESREKALKEIEYANKLLLETQGKTKESLNEINIINHRLSKRKEYLIGIEVEVNVISQAIKNNMNSVSIIEREITKLKKLYALMVVNLYKNRSKDYQLMYFFASENFNQLYRRIRTTIIYNNYLKKKRNELEDLKKELFSKNIELNILRKGKDELLKKTKNETVVIQKEVNQKNNLVTQLKKKQKEIEEDIKNKEKTARKLENELKRVIEEERRKIKSSGAKDMMTPNEKIISNDFEKNMGRLPWPTQKGIITGQYGEHPHPDYKSVTIRNDGIYISTAIGESARSIFKGVVSRVFTIPGENYTVIIKHGQYYTLYHNLINVEVKAGQSLNIKDLIGTVYTNEKTKETVLYFQIWKETERSDPELWLAPI
jgi:septal ring factor EnvC (AmiA/AmiB activator)